MHLNLKCMLHTIHTFLDDFYLSEIIFYVICKYECISISVPVLAYVQGYVNSIKSESDKLPNSLRNLKTHRKLMSFRCLFGLNFEDEGAYVFDRWSTFLTVESSRCLKICFSLKSCKQFMESSGNLKIEIPKVSLAF